MNALVVRLAFVVVALIASWGQVSVAWAQEEGPAASAPEGELHGASERILSVRAHLGIVPDFLGLEVNVALPSSFEVELNYGGMPPLGPDMSDNYSAALRAGYALDLDRNSEGWELLVPFQVGYRYQYVNAHPIGCATPPCDYSSNEKDIHGIEALIGLEVLYWFEGGVGAFDLRVSMGYTHFFADEGLPYGNPMLSVGAAF